MKTQIYEARLPALRVSQELADALRGRAKEQGLTLAETHRQVLAEALSRQAKIIPIVGRVSGETILWDRDLPEAA